MKIESDSFRSRKQDEKHLWHKRSSNLQILRNLPGPNVNVEATS